MLLPIISKTLINCTYIPTASDAYSEALVEYPNANSQIRSQES